MDLKVQYDKLLRFCTMKTKDKYLAEDIVQETFLKFWQSHTYEDTGKEEAYLFTIARNLCMDSFRRMEVLDIDDYPELQDFRTPAEEQINDRLAIEQALDRLSPELREIVTLRYISDVSAADIGKILGLSRFAVNRRLKDGLGQLRSYLEGGDSK